MTFELLADARTELDGAASLLTDVLGFAVDDATQNNCKKFLTIV